MIKRFISKLMSTKDSEPKEGTVKFFNNARGFGFIEVNGGDEDIFVHASNLIDKIRENDHVQFEVEQGKKGPSAVNVRVLR